MSLNLIAPATAPATAGAVIAGVELARLAGNPQGTCKGCVCVKGTPANVDDRSTDVAFEAVMAGTVLMCPVKNVPCPGIVAAQIDWQESKPVPVA